MSTIARGAKAGGGTDFNSGETIDPAEVNTDFNTIVTEINGGLDEDNISASANIPVSSLVTPFDASDIDDHSDSIGTARLVGSGPGDTASIFSSPPTDLEGEIENLRYRIEALQGYRTGVSYYDDTTSGANVNTAWVEPPIRGENLLANSGFEVFTGASGEAADGWTAEGTLATSVTTAAASISNVAGAAKRGWTFTNVIADSGLSQVVGGLRSNTKYLFGIKYIRNGGTLNFAVEDGLATGDYQNTAVSDNTTSTVQVAGIVVKSDATGSDMKVKITDSTTSGDATLIQAWFYELNDDFPNPPIGFPSQTATHNTEEVLPSTFTATQWNWETVGELGLAQYIPSSGYRLIYEVTVSFCGATAAGLSGHEALPTTESQEYGFRIQLDTGGGASTVDGPYVHYGLGNAANYQQGGVIRLQYVEDSPTPGSTYTFTTDVGAYNNTAVNTTTTQMTVNPTANGVQSVSKAWLRLERI